MTFNSKTDLLAHLSHRLKVSYCHQPMAACVVRRPQFALNDISETSRPRALIFGMKHCSADIYQVYTNGGHGVQNSPAVGDLVFENKIY